MENIQVPEWIYDLNEDELKFIRKFILSSGSLKELAQNYNVTYPTVRLKLDRLIAKINLTSQSEEDSYIHTIKKLAIDEKISIEVARLLINKYKLLKGEL